MQEATFTELRNHAKDYFDAVERGDTVRIFRNGKAIAENVPIRSGIRSWKREATPLTVKGLLLSRESQITRELLSSVVSLLELHPLRAMAGLHVACAIACAPDAFVSADQRQLSAARKAGLSVINAA
jgi:antitoxin (DNA-binding transcriptional repressor) of toxin-antitoxin stability system